MAASKRKEASPPAKETKQEHDEDEKALDPKLAEHPDEDESETSKPPNKRQKKSSTSSSKSNSNFASPSKDDSRSAVVNGDGKVKNQYGGAAYAKSGEDWHRSDFNPSPKGRTDDKTPLVELEEALKSHTPNKSNDEGDDKNVVYWMRMHDLRIHDNRALAHASALAAARRKKGKSGHLIALFVLTPGDFRAHDAAPGVSISYCVHWQHSRLASTNLISHLSSTPTKASAPKLAKRYSPSSKSGMLRN